MSDRPSNDSSAQTSASPWRKPTDGGWRTPPPGGASTPAAPRTTGVWRVAEERASIVPVAPQESYQRQPDAVGGWHLPKPEDTIIPATIIRPGEEDEIAASAQTTPADEAEAAEADVLPHDGEQAAEDEAVDAEEAITDEASEESAEVPLPFEGTEPESDEAPVDTSVLPFESADKPSVAETALDEIAAEMDADAETDADARLDAEPADDLDLDDDDDDHIGISELVALQSLANAPEVGAAARTGVGVAEADVKDESEAALDPAEYARRELERLRARAEASGASAEDAADFARQEYERLMNTGREVTSAGDAVDTGATGIGSATGAVATPTMTPEQRALAERYHTSEERAHALKTQFNAGLITREVLEAELKKLMVLEGQTWWMIGAQSDNWYKYENNAWTAARPPVLELEDQVNRAARGDMPRSSGDASLPYLNQAPASAEAIGDRTVPTSPVSVDPFSQPLPRQVPVRDPDLTQVATGVYGDMGATIPSDPALTVPNAGQSTVPSAAVASDVASIPSPVDYTPAGVTPDAAPEYGSDLYKTAVERQRANTVRTVGIAAAVVIGLLLLLGAGAAILAVVTYNGIADPWRDEIAALSNYQPQFRTVRILAADNSLIAELNSREGGARTTVSLQNVAPELIHAVVSVENPRYFSDPGWDPLAIGGVLLQNVTGGQIQIDEQTITQQIARRLVMQDNASDSQRNLQEIVIAAEIARTYDKEFILQLYLNEIFFGNQSFGIEAASQFYFQKRAVDLNIAEAALLAGLIQAPEQYDPVTNRDIAFDRMDYVLDQMAATGCLPIPHQTQPFCVTAQQVASGQVAVDKARVETRDYLPRESDRRYPHFVDYIQQQVEAQFGPGEMFRRGFSIRTTLVPNMQNTAEQALANQLRALTATGVNNGAIMVMNPSDGAVMAMVGSANYYNADIDGQVNDVFTYQAPGATIMPIVYTAALEGVNRADGSRAYYTPASPLWDVETTFQTTPPYTPVNADREYHGLVSMRSALANGYNITAVKTLYFTGLERFRETANRMGLDFLPEAVFNLRTAEGATETRLIDLVEAYATLANNGLRAQPYAILSITDANGNEVALPNQRPQPAQAVQPGIAYLMQHILSDNNARAPEFGTASPLFIPEYDGNLAAKSGASDGNRDLWTVGFTRNAVVGVWLGRNDNNPTFNVDANAAAQIWNQVMRVAVAGRPLQPFQNPGGVVQVQVCTLTGARYDPNVSRSCGSVRNELFLDTQPPPNPDQSFVSNILIDTWTGLRANTNCPANQEMGTFLNIDDPSAISYLRSAAGASTAAQLGIDPRTIQPAPTSECTTNTIQPVINITSPVEQQTVQGVVPIMGTVSASDFNRYQIEVASGSNPDAFTLVVQPTSVQQVNGTLGNWDTRPFQNGQYRIRLAMFSNTGGYAYRYVTVSVINPTPTPMPTDTPAPTATWTPIPFFTPLPFDVTPLPFDAGGVIDGGGAPTPTATISFDS